MENTRRWLNIMRLVLVPAKSKSEIGNYIKKIKKKKRTGRTNLMSFVLLDPMISKSEWLLHLNHQL